MSNVHGLDRAGESRPDTGSVLVALGDNSLLEECVYLLVHLFHGVRWISSLEQNGIDGDLGSAQDVGAMIGDGKEEGYFWIGCLLEKGRNVGSFLAHYLLCLFRGAFDRRKNNAIRQ